MGIFKLSNGEEYEIKGHTGKVAKLRIGRKYLTGNHEDIPVDEKFLEMPDKKVTQVLPLYNFNSGESYEAEDTYILAENKDYKEYEIVNYYDGEIASNVTGHFKIEVSLQLEEWRKRLFLNWKGNVNFFSFIRDLPEEILEKAAEGELDDQGVYYMGDEEEFEEELEMLFDTEEGDYRRLPVSERLLEDSIVGVKLIEYKEEIRD